MILLAFFAFCAVGETGGRCWGLPCVACKRDDDNQELCEAAPRERKVPGTGR
jgi:hypothetical protein